MPPTSSNSSPALRFPRTSQTGTLRSALCGVRDAGEDLADPGVRVPHGLPLGQPDLRHGPVAPDDLPELVPVWFGPVPLALRLVPGELVVGHADPQIPQLGHVGREELLAEALVGPGLDAPVQQHVLLLRRRTEEVPRRLPPPVDGVLEQFALFLSAADELEDEILAVAQVQRLLG